MAKNAKIFEERPWGTFEVLHDHRTAGGGDVVVKKVVVHPRKRLSYQSHQKRREHWLVVEGNGKVILDGEEAVVGPESKIFVDTGVKHRIINTHPTSHLVFVEVSLGEFDEFDIMRYEDDFGR